MNDRQKAALLRWLMFGALLSLVPIGVAYLVRAIVTSGNRPAAPLPRGDLFLLAATAAFAGLGNLVSRNHDRKLVPIMAGGVALINGLIAAFLYGAVLSANAIDQGSVILY